MKPQRRAITHQDTPQIVESPALRPDAIKTTPSPPTSLAHPDHGDDSAIAWLNKETAHATVVFKSPAELTAARRIFQQALEPDKDQTHTVCLYLDNPNSLKDFEQTLVAKNGKLGLEDGPFLKLLKQGGTLLLNTTQFTSAQLSAFNTLMQDQVWENHKLPANQGKPHVRVICLSDLEALRGKLDGAQISRTAFHYMADECFPPAADLDCQKPLPHYDNNPQIIDLKHDRAWATTLLGGPVIDQNQRWQQQPGALDADPTRALVLRNPPNDVYFIDQVLAWRQQGRPVRLEAGMPPADFERLTANKQAAQDNDVQQLKQASSAEVCNVNIANICDALKDYFGVANGQITSHPCLLGVAAEHAKRADGGLPLVYISSNLPQQQWDLLMQHALGFKAMAAPGIEVPQAYADKVFVLPDTQAEETAPQTCLALPKKGVQLLLTNDAALLNGLPERTSHLFVTPTMSGSDLISSLKQAKASQPAQFKIEYQQLLNDLQAGKTVLLHGLQSNPELQDSLASLLHPPHYLDVNGKRFDFSENGGLTGRLIVLGADNSLQKKYPLTAASQASLTANEWREQTTAKLAREFPAVAKQVPDYLDKLLTLYEQMQSAGFMPKKDIPASYDSVANIFRHVFNPLHGGLGNAIDTVPPQVLRSVFKDVLIGQYRRHTSNDERYACLKAWLKNIFSENISAMPVNTVDTARFAQLMTRARHVQDIHNHAWQFLNAFSPDIIQKVLAPEAQHSSSIQEKVTALVLNQARYQGIPLPDALAAALAKPSFGLVRSPIIAPAAAYDRPDKLPQTTKNIEKLKQVQSTRALLSLKGPPGAGKTYLTKHLRPDGQSPRHFVQIADIGTAAYNKALRAWAQDEGDGINDIPLLIDEANLTKNGNHDALRSLVMNRSILIEGKTYELTDKHTVIFTGNDDELPGRQRQEIASEHFATLQFKPMRRQALDSLFVQPLLKHAQAKLPAVTALAATPDGLATLGSHLLDVHQHLQASFPEAQWSPRNLEEFTAQLVHLIEREPHRANPTNLRASIAHVALNVYAGGLPSETRSVVEAWLKHHFALDTSIDLTTSPYTFDLDDSALANTASTQALANTVQMWLDNQTSRNAPGFNYKENALGQSGLLIEGPAARGKDAVVQAVLESLGRNYLLVNANPNSLDYLHEKIQEARTTGKVIVISEMNLLPSDILESELNGLLTGDVEAKPGFGVIATVNPAGAEGYAGRKSISTALANRFLKTVIDEYPPSEVAVIAHTIGKQLSIDGKAVDTLVEYHLDLLARLENYPSERKPGIRQLTNAMSAYKQGEMSIGEAFHRNYDYFKRLAEPGAGNTLNVYQSEKKDATNQLTQQLQQALRLAHPDCFSVPKLQADTTLRLASPAVYDANKDCIRFNPRKPFKELVASVLKMMDETTAPKQTTVTTPTPESRPAANAEQQARKLTSRERLKMGLKHLKKALTARCSRARAALSSTFSTGFFAPPASGMNKKSAEGTMGRVITDTPGRTYLVSAYYTPQSKLMQSFTECQGLADVTDKSALEKAKRIELDRPKVVSDPKTGQRRIYLLTEIDTRPTHVVFNQGKAAHVSRADNGAWYITLPEGQHKPGPLSYLLVPSQAIANPTVNVSSYPKLQPNKTRISKKLAEIKRKQTPDNPAATVKSLQELFLDANYFMYSDDKIHAEKINRIRDPIEKTQYFLTHGRGVCFEFN
ncbi:MAG: hypothetical protein ACK5NY_08565, partial [Burkholderiaceae bacterium]